MGEQDFGISSEMIGYVAEEVKAVVDLRPQGNGDTAVALTKDGIPLTFNYSVAFRIESWKEARDRGDEGDLETQGFAGIIAGHYPVYRHTIYRAVYGVVAGKNWITQIKGMAGGKIGAAIRNFRVDEIFVIDQDERVTIEETALQKIITQAKNSAIAAGVAWGVKVGGLNIKTIEMPEESQKKFLTQWRVLWQEQQALIEAKVKRLIAIIEAEGKLDVSKIETEARQWSVIQEAVAKLKAAEHDMKRKRLVAEIGDELAQKEGQATITNAEAQRQASELQANAEIQFIENMAKALERALGPTAAREILKEMFKHRLNLEQMQRVMALIDPASRIKERFFGTGPSGWPREDDQPPPNQSEA